MLDQSCIRWTIIKPALEQLINFYSLLKYKHIPPSNIQFDHSNHDTR